VLPCKRRRSLITRFIDSFQYLFLLPGVALAAAGLGRAESKGTAGPPAGLSL